MFNGFRRDRTARAAAHRLPPDPGMITATLWLRDTWKCQFTFGHPLGLLLLFEGSRIVREQRVETLKDALALGRQWRAELPDAPGVTSITVIKPAKHFRNLDRDV